MKRRALLLVGCMAMAVLLSANATAADEAGKAAPKPIVVKLKPMSTLDLDQESQQRMYQMTRGIYCPTMATPEGIKLPECKSSKRIVAVLAPEGYAGSDKTKRQYFIVLDESGGAETGYDTLYFDKDGDGDLREEKPILRMKDMPQAFARSRRNVQCFEPVTVAGVKLMPRVNVYSPGEANISLVPVKMYRGDLKVADANYDVYVGRGYMLTKTLDDPMAAVVVLPKGAANSTWVNGDSARSMHKFGDTFYTMKIHPKGKRVAFTPYTGDLGTLEIAAGGREGVSKVTMSGSLASDKQYVAVTDGDEQKPREPTSKCLLPVGDYYPVLMDIAMDDFKVMVSNNYYTGDKPRDSKNDQTIHITKDKPFVLDFSAKPEVIFTQMPSNPPRVKAGETIAVTAVLVDPQLNIMIRRLTAGQESLEPKIVITRAGGEKVAEGAMPFG